MSLFEKFHTLIILFAVILGIVLGHIPIIEGNADKLIVPFLLLMLFGLFFLSIPIRDLKSGFSNFKFAGTSLSINFIWTPILVCGLGAVFLSDHPALWIGFIMLMVTPCTDWYLIFTGIANGNVALATSILPVNRIVSRLLKVSYEDSVSLNLTTLARNSPISLAIAVTAFQEATEIK